jgi:hypothetical protein
LAQQQVDGKVHPIAFASRSLNPAEQKYTITELETLGMVCAVKFFRPYILGHRCIVLRTMQPAHHCSLLRIHLPSLFDGPCQFRSSTWTFVIAQGKSNQVPDALSRNPIAVSQILLFHSVTASGSSPDNTTTATSVTYA